MSRPVLIVLGASLMQMPAIRAADALGLDVLVFDGDKEAMGLGEATYAACVDLKDEAALLAYVVPFSARYNVVGVFTAGTDFSHAVAVLAQALNLPGHKVSATVNATDKARMRATLRSAGVPCPRFVELNGQMKDEEMTQLAQSLLAAGEPYQLVVKPVDSMGARGVRQVNNPDELLSAVTVALPFSRTGKVIVEEFVNGPEFSIDALVFDGEIVITGVADRHIFYPPYFIEMGHTLPSRFNPLNLAEIIETFKAGVRALGLTHGAAKGDMKWALEGALHGPVVGEIAARLSGGYMSGYSYPLSSGVDLTRAAIQLAIGQRPDNLKPAKRLWCAERALISLPGVVGSITEFEHVSEMPGYEWHHLAVDDGDRVVFPRNNVEKCGTVLATGASYDEAVAAAEAIRKQLFIRLVPGEAATRTFLFGSQTEQDSAFVGGVDMAGFSRTEILTMYTEITGHGVHTYSEDRRLQFERAIERGGLQGAVWYYDTFMDIPL